MKRRVKAWAIPIIDAKTVAEFVTAVNSKFWLNIPESWPDGSMLANLWALQVTVTESPDAQSYTATAKALYPAIGKPQASFAGRFEATVTGGTDFYLHDAICDERLTLDDLNRLQKEI